MRVFEAIESYLRRKRVNGLSYKTEENILSEFGRYIGDLSIRDVKPTQVVTFLNLRRVSNNTFIAKHRCLRVFFEFWTDRGQMAALPMPPAPKRDDNQLPMPFVYRQNEIRRLIQAIRGNQTHRLCALSEATLRTILLTLYGTGAMTSEVFWLGRDDIDLRRSLIFFRGDRVVLARKVPIGKDLRNILSAYLRSEERSVFSGQNVFLSKDGQPISRDMIVYSFARLRSRARIVRTDGGTCEPRMRDLRQTFAMHRLACWIREEADLSRMVPALSAYMGFATYEPVQRFLRIVPERFQRQLDELSPFKSKKHWREDPELMRFLASI